MTEQPQRIQQSLGPAIGVDDVCAGQASIRMMMLYAAMALSGILLLAF
ncbi:MAG: hypothetical protein Fues2KO_40400 [Fuerstiella sp.]|jgi:hypothetical protein